MHELSRRHVLALGIAALGTGACASDPVASPARLSPASSSLAPLSAEPMSAAPAPVVADLICREAWGAQPARPGGTRHTPVRLTIHHTGVVLGDNAGAPARLRQHQRYHQDSQGWIDIAYHVSVDRLGNLYELRSPDLVGDTATSYDPTGHFLVVCEGDFDQEAVTEAQLQGAAIAFAWAAQCFDIPTHTLAGHRDASGDTACPGADLYTHVTSGDLRRRIDALVAAGTVDLRPFCGPAAVARVGAIEEGR